MSRYSVSRVNTYLENPWKHWCKYIARYKPKDGEIDTRWMDRGTVMHRVMELIATGTDSQEALKQASAVDFSQESIDGGIRSAERYLEYFGIAGLLQTTEVEKEITLSISYDTGIPDTSFIGYVDAVRDNGDGTVTLVDYKTFSTKPDVDEKVFSLQANLYMYVMTQLGYTVRDFVFECVNPKEKMTKRNYTHLEIRMPYREELCKEFYEQFCIIVRMIETNPEFKLYKKGSYMPDVYDDLFKVWQGIIVEDLETFLEEHFIVPEEDVEERDDD